MFNENFNAITYKNIPWKPLYRNNLKSSEPCGFYCVLTNHYVNTTDKSKNLITGTKITILFDYDVDETGFGSGDYENPDYYIIFQKDYPQIIGEETHPAPYTNKSNAGAMHITLNDEELNNFGEYQQVVTDEEKAKKIAFELFNIVTSNLLESITIASK